MAGRTFATAVSATSQFTSCPDCRGELDECEEGREQYQEELTAIRAVVMKVSGKWPRCPSCGRPVRGRHLGPTSEGSERRRAGGAAGVGLACSLHKEYGLSVRQQGVDVIEALIELQRQHPG